MKNYFWKLRNFDGKIMWRLSASENAAGTDTLRTAGEEAIEDEDELMPGKENVRVREGDLETERGETEVDDFEADGESGEAEVKAVCGCVCSQTGALRIEVIWESLTRTPK